jgi:hypothetical protein
VIGSIQAKSLFKTAYFRASEFGQNLKIRNFLSIRRSYDFSSPAAPNDYSLQEMKETNLKINYI